MRFILLALGQMTLRTVMAPRRPSLWNLLRVAIVAITADLALTTAAQAETPKTAPDVKPIESLWLMTVPHFPGASELDTALARELKEWQATGAFDAISLHHYPPTFADEKEFTRQANALIKEMGIGICQAKGINRFQMLFPPQGSLDRGSWLEFYRTLPKVGPAAAK